MKNARISIRKTGTRAGQPTYSATCASCGSVVIVGGAPRQTCVSAGEKHRRDGCAITLRWSMCDASGRFRPR